ncbi:TRAP transporter small permease, partial [Microbacterium sp.]
ITGVMMVHITANAVMRQLLREPLPSTNEIVGYWELPLVALLGLLAAQLRRDHIEVSLFVSRLPRQTRTQFAILSSLLVASLSVGFAWFGLVKALEDMTLGVTAGVSYLPIWPVTIFVPIVFATLAVLCVMDIIELLRGVSVLSDADDESIVTSSQNAEENASEFPVHGFAEDIDQSKAGR